MVGLCTVKNPYIVRKVQFKERRIEKLTGTINNIESSEQPTQFDIFHGYLCEVKLKKFQSGFGQNYCFTDCCEHAFY